MARSYVSFPMLVSIIGEEDAVALCRAHGGMALYVTAKPERSSLVGIICGCAIESLTAAYGSEEIMLPRGPLRPVPIKECVVAMLEAGHSHSEVARECGCTTRYSQLVAQNTDLKPTPRRKAPKPRRKAERKA